MTQKQIEKLIEALKLRVIILKAQIELKILRKKVTVPNLPQPKIVMVHHGGGEYSFEQVNAHHKNLWGFKSSFGYYLGYHKWIRYGGAVEIARRDNEKGAHAVDPMRPHWWNKNSVGICLRGNTNNYPITDWQLVSLKRELDEYKAKGFIIKMHKQIVPTSCPGRFLEKCLRDNKYII